MKMVIGAFALLIIVVLAIFFSQRYIGNTSGLSLGQKATATVENQTFNLLLARSDEEKQVGLSNKASLDKNTGMLFVFDKPDYYSFWMRNMKFPIDIIYLNGDKVVTVHKNVPPASENTTPTIYKPSEPADKVLEITAGLADEFGIEKGDLVKIEGI